MDQRVHAIKHNLNPNIDANGSAEMSRPSK